MKDSTKLFLILGGIIVVLALGFYFVDKGIQREGTVIGTFVQRGYTYCIVLVDGVRYDDSCHNIVGDNVHIRIYQNGQGSIYP